MENYCDTNPQVISMMIDRLQWKHGEYILEPSAGTGAIIKEILYRYVVPDNILREYIHFCELDAKRATQTTDNTGTTFKDFDFLCLSLSNKYQKIVSVPPFQNMECIDHTMKMFEHLESKGRMMARMIVLLPTDSLKEPAFMKWINERGGVIEDVTEASCNYECETFILEINKP